MEFYCIVLFCFVFKKFCFFLSLVFFELIRGLQWLCCLNFALWFNDNLGVATFCRVKSAFSSSEVALPIAAEEGFTGLLRNGRKDENHASVAGGLEEFAKDDLLQVDSEGRCVITDHSHFGGFLLEETQ